jgi:hypothetical protein
MRYIFSHPMPVPWLLADVVTLIASVVVVAFVVRKSKHPTATLLECFGFVFLYAGIFENFAVVNQWYVYGRSLVMFGDVPLSVPLIEMDVFMLGLWMMDAMEVPQWSKPFILGLLGMLQDFSLDPVAVNQIFTSGGVTSGRWTWLLPPGMVNIYGIPVYNFSGWMLIMLYGSIWVLLGRWWFKRSGYKPVIGALYPILAFVLALATMVSPLSQLLLWLAPFFGKGGNAEWAMLGFHLVFPSVLLAALWRGRMKRPLGLRENLPVFVVPAAFHLTDIVFAASAGYTSVLWLVMLASAVHVLLLVVIFARGAAAGKAGKAVLSTDARAI